MSYRRTGQEMEPGDNSDGNIRGNSDPSGFNSPYPFLGSDDASNIQTGQWFDGPHTSGQGHERTNGGPVPPQGGISDRPYTSEKLHLMRRVPSVRIAVMGRVQEPGEWLGGGPSFVDRESKVTTRFKKDSRMTASGSVRGSAGTSYQSRSDLADLANI